MNAFYGKVAIKLTDLVRVLYFTGYSYLRDRVALRFQFLDCAPNKPPTRVLRSVFLDRSVQSHVVFVVGRPVYMRVAGGPHASTLADETRSTVIIATVRR